MTLLQTPTISVIKVRHIKLTLGDHKIKLTLDDHKPAKQDPEGPASKPSCISGSMKVIPSGDGGDSSELNSSRFFKIFEITFYSSIAEFFDSIFLVFFYFLSILVLFCLLHTGVYQSSP